MLRILALLIATATLTAHARGEAPPLDRLPEAAKRLDTAQIEALMGTGAPFTFVGADGKATGTSTWNRDTGTAYGAFVWDGRLSGTWNMSWQVRDDLSCLEPAPGKWECQLIYGYEDGFFEVNQDGSIHTYTTPKAAADLDTPLSETEAVALFLTMMKWGQKIPLTLVSSSRKGDVITIVVADPDGKQATFPIDAATGQMLSAN